MTKIAIFGFGIVGGGIAEVLSQNYQLIKKSAGEDIEIKYIFDKRKFEGTKWESIVTDDINVILDDPEVSIVCETMGGVHPAYDFSLAALKAGKSVVTSNKAVVAEKGPVLLDAARENNVSYLYEASVGGGIPIIHAMNSSLSGLEIYKINGILNGTTNYILTSMKEKGSSYDEALKKAQELGYAEKDPTADVSGADSCRKICILAALAYGKLVDFENVSCRGIDDITKDEQTLVEEIGASVKLVASASLSEGKLALSVAPCAVLPRNPLYAVNGVFNAVLVEASGLGEVLFCGQGAGRMPTASAVMSDIIDIVAKNAPQNEPWSSVEKPEASALDEIKNFAVRAKTTAEDIKALIPDAVIMSEGNETVSFAVKGVSSRVLDSLLSKTAVLAVLDLFD